MRRKLEDDFANPRWILIVRQSGYRLNLEGQDRQLSPRDSSANAVGSAV